ncbi:MAG TPA: RNA polymerase sigma factor SigJ, partial [Burkholderiales bacterium]|nr:RNA polymerase sigma factor SigJ [Burkholderiales bacterium]
MEIFDTHRKRLMGIAYRMLGTRSDAEDILQDAYVKWMQSDASEIRNPAAWLVSVVTRLSIDRLRAAKAEREHYVGQWIPEPWVTEHVPPAEQPLEMAGDISVAFLMVLERLAPEERAAFLLKTVFDFDYPEIAQMLGKSGDACRQLVHRARQRVKLDRPRFEVSREAHLELLGRFIEAARSGKREKLTALFSEDVTLTGDGGGKVLSVLRPLRGPERVAALFCAIRKRLGERMGFRVAEINGVPGILRD